MAQCKWCNDTGQIWRWYGREGSGAIKHHFCLNTYLDCARKHSAGVPLDARGERLHTIGHINFGDSRVEPLWCALENVGVRFNGGDFEAWCHEAWLAWASVCRTPAFEHVGSDEFVEVLLAGWREHKAENA